RSSLCPLLCSCARLSTLFPYTTLFRSRPDVVQRLLQGDDRVLAVLLTGALERAVDDALGDRLLAVQEDLVDQLRDDRRAEDGVDDELALGSGALTRHYFFSFFAP